jgi:tungstate transport system substrate-binding protein
MNRRTLLLAALLLAAVPGRPDAAPPAIVLASTTSVENSGLLARILPAFTRRTGIEVRVVAQGTGQALATAARGDADLVLVHDPDAEAEFMKAGHGADRRVIAWNDFILVGPRADPARVAGGRDAVAALAAIAAAGAPFVSRGDRSGTDALEKRLWRQAGIAPSGGWYRDIGGGMGAALNAAAAMDAYTISDRGTWLGFGNPRDLAVLVQGDRRLLNRYAVILLDRTRHPAARHAEAAQLAAWLASPEGQEAIGAYQVGGERLFHPVADPEP